MRRASEQEKQNVSFNFDLAYYTFKASRYDRHKNVHKFDGHRETLGDYVKFKSSGHVMFYDAFFFFCFYFPVSSSCGLGKNARALFTRATARRALSSRHIPPRHTPPQNKKFKEKKWEKEK